jgi:hypothetical protein
VKTQIIRITYPDGIPTPDEYIRFLYDDCVVELLELPDDETLEALINVHKDADSREIIREIAARVWHVAHTLGREEALNETEDYIQGLLQ